MNLRYFKRMLMIFGAALPLALGPSLLGAHFHFRPALLAAGLLLAGIAPFVGAREASPDDTKLIWGSIATRGEVLWEADSSNFRVTAVLGNPEETLGYGAGRWLANDRYWPGHIAVEDRERVLKACRSAIQTGEQNLRLEYQALSSRGERVWVENSVQVLRDARGKPRRLLGRMVNLTKQKRAAEIIRQSQKMEEVTRLVGGVAHDFNNLLTVIGGHSDLLLTIMDSADPRRASIEEIKKAGERAASLTRQLLAFSRKRPSSKELVDLSRLVANLCKMLRRMVGEHIELATSSPTAPCNLIGDAGQLEQVIINLVVNARDAMPGGGRLRIETATCDISEAAAGSPVPAGKYVSLSVIDAGCGIGPEIRRRIFEPFFTTKEPGKGTGLGLAMVQEIVRDHGGAVEVDSAVGQGTTFRLYFPRCEPSLAVCPSRPQLAGTRRGWETILVVEDEENVRAMIKQLLRAYGYEVLDAASGEAALALVERHSGAIHLLLSDVVMPRMNGPEVARRLTACRPEMRVLYMSGYARESVAQYAHLEREIPYLQKPFTPEKLAGSVREALDAGSRATSPQSQPEPCVA